MASITKTILLIAGQALWVPGLFAAQSTVQDARKFLEDAEQRLLVLANEAQQASWVQENFITSDTEALAALANQRATDEQVRLAKEAKRFDGLTLPPDLARKMRLLRIGFTLATPADPKESEEVSRLAAELDGMYGKGKYCPPALASSDKKCLDIGDITRIMAASSNPGELLDAWKGWHAIAPPMRKDFTRFVELSNKGARELGFRDTGAMWRSKYDMPPDDFAKEVDRLWAQVKPLGRVQWREGVLRVETVRILRAEYPAAQPRQARVVDNHANQPLADALPLKFREHEDVGQPGECSVIGDHPGEADLRGPFVHSEGQRVLYRAAHYIERPPHRPVRGGAQVFVNHGDVQPCRVRADYVFASTPFFRHGDQDTMLNACPTNACSTGTGPSGCRSLVGHRAPGRRHRGGHDPRPSLPTEGDARVCAKRALHLLRSRLRPRRRICRTRRLARRRLAEQPLDRPRQLPDFAGALDDHHIGAGGLFGQTQRLHKSRE